jgi:hypothetical protein
VKRDELFLEMKTSEVPVPSALNFTEAYGNRQSVNVLRTPSALLALTSCLCVNPGAEYAVEGLLSILHPVRLVPDTKVSPETYHLLAVNVDLISVFLCEISGSHGGE